MSCDRCMSNFAAVRFPTLPLEREAGMSVPQPISVQDKVDHIDDEELIYRLREGDHEACSCLFKRFAQSVRNVGRRVLRDNAEADDLVQEVFLYLHRKCALFNS